MSTDNMIVVAIASVVMILILTIGIGTYMNAVNDRQFQLEMAQAGMEQTIDGYNTIWQQTATFMSTNSIKE